MHRQFGALDPCRGDPGAARRGAVRRAIRRERTEGEPNPVALKVLADRGHAIDALRSKSWSEFAAPGAPPVDLVITVCNNAAGETCPVWPGHPVQAHWGIPDPAGNRRDGDEADFVRAYKRLDERIDKLLALDEDVLTSADWRAAVSAIGRESEGATGG